MNRSPWRVKNLQVDEMRGLEFLDKAKHVGSRIFRLFLWIVTYGDDINFARCNHRLNIAANPSLFLRRESSFLADEKRYLVLPPPPRDRDFRTHGLLAMHRGGENTVWQVSAKFSSTTTVRPFPSRTSKLGYAWFEINGELARQSTKPWSTSFCCCCCCCWTDAGSLLSTCTRFIYLKTGRTERYVSNLDPFVRICRLTRCRYSTSWTGISLTANLLSGIKSLRIKSDWNGDDSLWPVRVHVFLGSASVYFSCFEFVFGKRDACLLVKKFGVQYILFFFFFACSRSSSPWWW